MEIAIQKDQRHGTTKSQEELLRTRKAISRGMQRFSVIMRSNSGNLTLIWGTEQRKTYLIIDIAFSGGNKIDEKEKGKRSEEL